MSGLKETENPGVPCEQSSRLGEPLQPRDLRLTRLSGKFTARFSSEAAGFPAPQSRSEKTYNMAFPTSTGASWQPTLFPCPFHQAFTHSHKTGVGNSNAHSGQARQCRRVGTVAVNGLPRFHLKGAVFSAAAH